MCRSLSRVSLPVCAVCVLKSHHLSYSLHSIKCYLSKHNIPTDDKHIIYIVFKISGTYVVRVLLFPAFMEKLGLLYLRLDKAMAPHSSTLVWKIPWTEEPGGAWRAAAHGVTKSQT